MQTIKKVILVVICLVVLLTSFIHPAGAVDQDMIEQGWLYEETEDVYYKEPYMEMMTPSFLIATEPNYSFDPNKLPWLEAPSYVQDIIHYEMPSMAVDEYVKVPFVCVVRASNFIRVCVGWNLCLGRIYTYYASGIDTKRGNIGLFMFPSLASSKYSVCYSADYNIDYSIKVPWRAVEPSDYGSTGNVKNFPGIAVSTTGIYDFYCYGANYGKNGNTTSFQVYATPQTVEGVKQDYRTIMVVQNPLSGFSSGRCVSWQDDFSSCYFTAFTPKSIEQIEQETQKGIWDSIKELPTKIADSIKGFFTSLGDRISGFFESLKNYLLYFQDTKPEHVNPFNNLLADVKIFFEQQMSDVDDFKRSLNNTLDNVVSYIQTGSGVVNTFLTAVPILSAFITFFVVFYVVRKVVGR